MKFLFPFVLNCQRIFFPFLITVEKKFPLLSSFSFILTKFNELEKLPGGCQGTEINSHSVGVPLNIFFTKYDKKGCIKSA